MILRGALLFLPVALVAMASSCASSPAVGTTRVTAAPMGAGSPQLRTVDNAGFVYPGGQTAEVGQGVSPAVIGRGGYLTPPPATEVPPAGPAPAMSGRGMALPTGADRHQSIARVASAICDHERTCGRIGSDDSNDACANEQRARLGDRFASSECGEDVRGDRLAACLRAIRAAGCKASVDPSALPVCAHRAPL